MNIFRMDRDSQVVRNTRFATAIRDATSHTKKSDLLKTGAPARDVFPFFFLSLNYQRAISRFYLLRSVVKENVAKSYIYFVIRTGGDAACKVRKGKSMLKMRAE